MKIVSYSYTSSFVKSFKKLQKKYSSLPEDLEVAKRNAIELCHVSNINNGSSVPITGFENDSWQIFKLRKFACKTMKGKGAMSGIRIIYAFNRHSNEVSFIDIYYKGVQASENRDIIRRFLEQQIVTN